MNHPVKAKRNKANELVDLYFQPRKELPISHYVRGAICFPTGRWPGYMLVAGQDRTRWEQPINIYEEYPFWTISTVGDSVGLWFDLKEAWIKYFCYRYFTIADQKEIERYRKQIRTEKLVNPKPVFRESPYSKAMQLDADNLILEYMRKPSKLKIDGDKEIDKERFSNIGGALHKQLELILKGSVRDDDDSIPAVRALRALVCGYDRTPYTMPVSQEEDVPKSYFS